MHLTCTHCKQTFEIDASQVGSMVACPLCEREVAAPKLVAIKRKLSVQKPDVLKHESVIPKPVALGPVAIRSGFPISAPKRKRNLRPITMYFVCVLVVLIPLILLGRERNWRKRHLWKVVAEAHYDAFVDTIAGTPFEPYYDYKDFPNALGSQSYVHTYELFGPICSWRNIRSLFGGRQCVLLDDRSKNEEAMVLNAYEYARQHAYEKYKRERQNRLDYEAMERTKNPAWKPPHTVTNEPYWSIDDFPTAPSFSWNPL